VDYTALLPRVIGHQTTQCIVFMPSRDFCNWRFCEVPTGSELVCFPENLSSGLIVPQQAREAERRPGGLVWLN